MKKLFLFEQKGKKTVVSCGAGVWVTQTHIGDGAIVASLTDWSAVRQLMASRRAPAYRAASVESSVDLVFDGVMWARMEG